MEKNSIDSITRSDILERLGAGYCREWSVGVIKNLRGLHGVVAVEAREVEISPDHWHTFVQVVDDVGQIWVLDQKGVWKLEVSPEIYKSSRRDSLLMSVVE